MIEYRISKMAFTMYIGNQAEDLSCKRSIKSKSLQRHSVITYDIGIKIGLYILWR